MNRKIFVFCVILCAGVIVFCLGGCKKDAPAETPKAPEGKVAAPKAVEVDPAKSAKSAEEILKETGNDLPPELKKALMEIAAKDKAATVQTTCPVMAGETKEDIFVEYKGQKVYFCCPPCKEDFNADPEKYISKLPQFKNSN